MSDSQIVGFMDQPHAIDALLADKIDAYASTAVGKPRPGLCPTELEVVGLEQCNEGSVPVQAPSRFNQSNHARFCRR